MCIEIIIVATIIKVLLSNICNIYLYNPPGLRVGGLFTMLKGIHLCFQYI